MNSSADMPAYFRTPLSVPVFSSIWFGTTQPEEPRRITMWLPRCRTTTKPKRCKARIASAPDTTGNLGMFRNLK